MAHVESASYDGERVRRDGYGRDEGRADDGGGRICLAHVSPKWTDGRATTGREGRVESQIRGNY